MEIKLTRPIILIACLLLSISSCFAVLPKRITAEFISLNDSLETGFEIFVNEKDLTHDISTGDFDLKIFFDGRQLLRGKTYPQNIKVEIYRYIDGEKSLYTIINRTVKSEKAATRLLLITTIPRVEETQNLYFDIYDSNNTLYSTFSKEVTITRTGDGSVTDFASVPDINCQEGDGECLIEYLLRQVTFSVNYDRNLKTVVYKNDKGRYTVNIPIKKGRTLKKKVKDFNVKGGASGNSASTALGSYPFFENEEQTGRLFWDDVNNAIKFNFDGAGKSFSFKDDGSFELGSKLSFTASDLSDNPSPGSLEYDGKNLYLTNETGRVKIGAEGPQGPPGPAGSSGSGSGSGGIGIDLSNGGYLNGTINFVTGGLIQDAIFNGGFQYRTGASNGLVLTSDANGNAHWDNISIIINSTILSTGPIGAVQFSGTSNGFSNDANNFFWDDSNNRLGIGTNTPLSDIHINNTTTANMKIQTTGNSVTGRALFQMLEASGSNGWEFSNNIALDGNNNFSISRLNNATRYFYQTITRNGLVGINDTTPNAQLDINGSIAIRDGTQAAGFVLTSNINGDASWQNPSSLLSGSATASGPAGAVQFSDGVNGFSSNESNFYWDDSNGRLGIRTNNPFRAFDVAETMSARRTETNFERNHIELRRGITGSDTRVGAINTGRQGGSGEYTMYFVNTSNGRAYQLQDLTIFNDGKVGINFPAMSGFPPRPKASLDIRTFDANANVLSVHNDSMEEIFTVSQSGTIINGNLSITDGTEADGFVLTSNSNGDTSWQDPSSLISGSATASGPAGAIQFSDGANGFNSDASNLSWNNGSKRLGIGRNPATASLEVNGTLSGFVNDGAFTASGNFTRANNTTPTAGATFIFNRTRGTLASPASVNPGDTLGYYRGTGYAAGAQRVGAELHFTVDGPVSSTSMPTRIEFKTNDLNSGVGVPPNRMVIKSNGLIGINTDLPSSQLEIHSNNGTNVGLSIRAFNGQSANLTEWQNSNGTNLLRIANDGAIQWSTFSDRLISPTGGTLTWSTPFASSVNFASGQVGQSSAINLVTNELKNAGLVHYDIANARGRLLDIYSQPAVDITVSPSDNELIRFDGFGTADVTSTANWSITSAYPAKETLIIQGANGQSANLTEWQDFNGNTLVSISETGKLTIADGTQADGFVLTSDTNGLASWQDIATILNGSGVSSGVAGAIQFSDGAANFSSDDGNLFWDISNGRLGIGTNTPSHDLSVAGNILYTGTINNRVIMDNSRIYHSNNNSLLQLGSSIIAEANNKDLELRPAAGGFVGVRTNSPSKTFEVNGETLLSTDNGLLIPLTSIGANGQVANLTEWQDFNGTTFAHITEKGELSNHGGSSSWTNQIIGENGSINTTFVNQTALGSGAQTTHNNATAIGYNARAQMTYATAIGSQSRVTGGGGGIAIGYASLASTNEFVAGGSFSSISIQDVYFGTGKTSSTPLAYTIHGTGAIGTDNGGASVILAGGRSTGSGNGGDLIFQTANGGASGTTIRDLHERMRITQAGRTIINGSLQILDGTQANGYVLTSDANGLASWQAAPSGVGVNGTASGVAGSVQFSDGTGGFNSDDSNFFWDGANGRLGIGTNTPDADIEIFDNNGTLILGSGATNNGVAKLRFDGNTNTTASTGYVQFFGGTQELSRISGVGGNWSNNRLKIGMYTGNTTFSTDLFVFTASNTVANEGEFSVGSANGVYDARLRVFDSKPGLETVPLTLGNSATPVNSDVSIGFTSYNSGIYKAKITAHTPRPTNVAGELHFFTNKTGTTDQLSLAMIIDSNGNVGIGQNQATAKLDLNGSIAIRDGTEADGFVLTSDANGLASWQATSGGSPSSGVAGAIQFSDGSNGFDSNGTDFIWSQAYSRLELDGNLRFPNGGSVESANNTNLTLTTVNNIGRVILDSQQGVNVNLRSNSTGAFNIQNANGTIFTVDSNTEEIRIGRSTLAKDTYILKAANSPSGSHQGNDLKIQAGNSGTGTTSGGDLYLFGGISGGTGANGDIILAHNGNSIIGNVGIGNTSPAGRLEVNGSTIIDGVISSKRSFDNTSGAAVTIDWNESNRQEITLAHNATFTFTDPTGIANLTLFIIQDATGSRVPTWPANVRWSGGSAPTLTTTANQMDIVSCVFRSGVYYCQAALDFTP
jgi:ribosomal protein S6E (S10)